MSYFVHSTFLKHARNPCDGVTHLRPYEAKLVEHRQAFPLDGQTHATTGTNGDGNLVCAHWHIDWAQEELEKNGDRRSQVEHLAFSVCVCVFFSEIS